MTVTLHTATKLADVHSVGGAERMRGKDRSARPWRRLRKQVLTRDMYTCQAAKADGTVCGRVDGNNEVDHIKPLHMGGLNTSENLQTICQPCHRMKTAAEAGRHGNASMTPAWLPKFEGHPGSLVIVYGRPGADLEDRARLMARGPDMVLSLDRLANDYGKPLHSCSLDELNTLIRVRNQRIADYMKAKPNYRLFVIATCGVPAHREYWTMHGAELYLVDTPLEVCQRRITNMGLPPATTQKMMQAAQDWM